MKLQPSYRSKWNAKRKSLGLCCTCSVNKPPEGRRQCDTCAEKRRIRDRARYSSGLCSCSNKRQEGKAKCKRCEDRQKVWMSQPENRKRWNKRVNENNARLRLQVIEHYGGRCSCCGESGPPFLTIDHINNDGAADRKLLNYNGGYWWRKIIKLGYPSNLQVLCWNCNAAKAHYGHGVCPHKLPNLGALSPSLKPLARHGRYLKRP